MAKKKLTEKELLERIDQAAADGRTKLDLSGKDLTSLPAEIGWLTNLTYLSLGGNQLKSLPSKIFDLTKLTMLALSGNQLTEVPSEIGQLTNLTDLWLHGNQLTELPSQIGQLTNLELLWLQNNQLTSLPAEIGKLTNLTVLALWSNQLKVVPVQIYKLTKLSGLWLDNNQLTELPSEIANLTNLTYLVLHNNQLTELPAEIGQLINLKDLRLHGNQLTELPVEIGNLKKLKDLKLKGNPLESPPSEVVKQGTEAVLEYLRAQLKEKERQWVSKMLVVGEGGVGKTSLLRALRGEEFIEGLETTHGVGVEKLELVHPAEAGVTMKLNTWDFGGQQIYHATHQFFLTGGSLFVLVWDARHGWEAGKLYQWLDRIQAKAPESPVLLLAAHIDERDADLPLEDLRKKYKQIVGHYKVSNKTGAGIDEIREAIAKAADGLPLMGKEWPASWLDAANEIRERPEHYITPRALYNVMAKHNVKEKSADVLAQWLHELGDILYFKEDEELNDWVILNPQWITEAISKVLESKKVIKKDGIFTRRHMDELWSDVAKGMREHFLCLMEKFDLSYRIPEHEDRSLVVERLPLDPPDFKQSWEKVLDREGCKEISMKFELSSVPAGIPTWFIARSHRFTTHTHWRSGALFADTKEERHLGLVEADLYNRYLQLTVRGPVPHNFFVLLRDGLELTLARFPGLKIERTVPCTGHDDAECSHEFDLKQLEKAIERTRPKLEIQCPEAFEDVSISGMLFGLHWRTQDNVIKRIDELEAVVVAGDYKILTELGELRKLTQREFLNLFKRDQRLAESHCPRVFTLRPVGEKRVGPVNGIFKKKWELQLYCEAPGCWHMTNPKLGGKYPIKEPLKWLESLVPHLRRLIKVFKFVAPLAGPWLAYAAPVYEKLLKTDIDLMKELVGQLPEFTIDDDVIFDSDSVLRGLEGLGWAEGSELRAVRRLLDELDPSQKWGGLKKVLTPEGHYLWLCADHAEEYAR